LVWVLRGVIPPAKDDQQAAYTLHGGLVSSLLAPDRTNMANVAHLMCELVTNPKAWDEWKGKLPVIINATVSKS